MFNFAGKTVLITGANRGIGLAFVEACLAEGATKIIAAGRDLSALQSVVNLNDSVIEALELDVTNDTHIEKLKDIQKLDVLINNAGIANGCFNLSENAVEIAQKEMQTHYFGPMQITQNLIDALKKSEQAAIINIASIAALSNFPSVGPYSTTKAALMSFTQGLRIELSQTSVNAFCVYPGPTDTRLAPGDIPKATTQSVAKNTLEAVKAGQLDVYPDDFSKAMFDVFVSGADNLAKAYSDMHQ